jgi:HlyD family secretion protein
MNGRTKAAAIAAGLILAAVLAWIAFSPSRPTEYRLVASGTVEATEADLGFPVPGRIAALSVREGDRVAAGAELARLDAAELTARRELAAAQVDAARAQLAELRRGGRSEELLQARSALAAAASRAEDARRVLERSERLEHDGAISPEALDHARTAHEVARSQWEQARQQLRIVETGARPERIAAQEAQVRQADALLAQADALLDHAVIRAPFGGVVAVRHRHPGETVSPGAPVVTLRDDGDRWVRVYVREDRLGALALGQPARIRAAGSATDFAGTVSFIAGQAEFTPRNVQTPEDRVRLVYMVKVSLTGDDAGDLKAGLPADVEFLPPRR